MAHKDSHSRDFAFFIKRQERLIEQNRIRKKSESPTFLFLAHKFGLTDIEIYESFTDGGNDLGVDAVHIEHRSEDPKVHIIQSKCRENDKTSRNPFPYSELTKITRFLAILRDENANLEKLANIELVEKIRTIRHLQSRGFPDLIVWLVSNGRPAKKHEIESEKKRLLKDVEVEEFHLSNFIDLIEKRRQTIDTRVFYARDRGLLDITMDEIRCVNGLIAATELCDLIRHRSDQIRIDPTVFNLNVRGFLGSTGEINKNIYRSATSSRRDRFWILNNGITMVAEDGKVEKQNIPPKIRVKNLSIVNGAQTCSSIFNAVEEFSHNPEYFTDVSIPFRLLFTKNADLVHQIAVTTNSQNRVNPRDLKANDPLQKDIEIALRKVGIGYIRRRGDEVSEEILERLDALKAGQIILSYQLGRPDKAKADSDSIFTSSYNTVFNKFEVKKMIRGNFLYNQISEKREKLLNAVLRQKHEDTDAALLKYGSFHVLALCGVIEELYSDMSDTSLIDRALEIIRTDYSASHKSSLYVYFRKPSVTKKLLNIPVQPELPLKLPE